MSETKALTRGQWFTLAAAFLAWMFDGVEMGLFPLVSRPALQDLVGLDDAKVAQWASIIMACFLLGAAIGGVSFGWVGDKIGRVRGLVSCMLLFSTFTGACYFATSAWHIGIFLFMASLGMGGAWSLAVALVMECWPERHRPKLAGLIGAAANFGFLFIAFVAFSRQVTVDDWRWMMLVGASPAILAVLVAIVVPESELWKASVKKGGNGKSPVVEIFRKGLIRKTLFGVAFAGIPLIGTWAAVSAYIPTWTDQIREAEVGKTMLSPEQVTEFATAKNPKERSAMLKSMLDKEDWIALRRQSSRAKATVQMFLAVGAIIGCFAASTLGGRFGRRPVYFGLCLLSLISCGYLFWFLPAVFNAQFMIVVGAVGAITAGFYGWLPLYLPELFPTRVRATGQGFSFNIGRVLAACGTLSMSGLVATYGDNYGHAMGTVTLVYLVGLVLIWFAPETKGKPLPE
jgi:MFS family permease